MPTKYQTLHCEAGDHDYDWPVKRGRKPRNCPAHKPAVSAPAGITGESLAVRIQGALDRAKERSIHCLCDIRTDMTRDELTDLKAGCTASPRGGMAGDGAGYVCPVLDSVRRAIGPRPETEEYV